MISLREMLDDLEEEFKTKDMPNGTSWRVSSGKGWAAKNRNGDVNYWYGPDDTKNKESADKWRVSENAPLNEEDPCWDGYQQVGMKEKDGKQVPNCVPIDEDSVDEFCSACLIGVMKGDHPEHLGEAEYQGRKVQLGKPRRTPDGPKKFSVFVKNSKGNVVKVNFGDPNMSIKKSNPKKRKSFRARHNCDTAKDRTTPRYWSCKAW